MPPNLFEGGVFLGCEGGEKMEMGLIEHVVVIVGIIVVFAWFALLRYLSYKQNKLLIENGLYEPKTPKDALEEAAPAIIMAGFILVGIGVAVFIGLSWASMPHLWMLCGLIPLFIGIAIEVSYVVLAVRASKRKGGDVVMTTLADYIVITDKFELWLRKKEKFKFDVPRDIARSGESKRPIIAFFVNPSSNAHNLVCEFEINDQVIDNYAYFRGDGRGHWVVLKHENLNAGAENTLQFRVESGAGTVVFSDVILWFQRNVYTRSPVPIESVSSAEGAD